MGIQIFVWFFFQHFIVKNFKHTETLKEFYSEHLYPYHLDSTTDILLYLLYQYLSIHQSYFLMHFPVFSKQYTSFYMLQQA